MNPHQILAAEMGGVIILDTAYSLAAHQGILKPSSFAGAAITYATLDLLAMWEPMARPASLLGLLILITLAVARFTNSNLSAWLVGLASSAGGIFPGSKYSTAYVD